MDIKKIQVITFAIKNRLRGYQLLQNPKGTSPYQVKMIKKYSGISYDLDRFDHYYTKSRDFENPHKKTEEQTLLVTRLMFWKSKNDKKTIKEVIYNKTNSDGKFVSKIKNNRYELDEYINRDTSYINQEHHKGYHKELFPGLFIPLEISVPTIETIADRETDKFFRQRSREKKFPKISFWTVLKNNLRNN